MGDKLRLMLTGVAAIGAVGLAVSGPSLWSLGDDDDEDRQHQVTSPADLRDFAGIRLQGPDNVVVTRGAVFAVRTAGDPDAVKHLAMSVEDGVLNVVRRNGSRSVRPATVHVTMPDLASVWLVGSGNIQVAQVAVESFEARVDGSGVVEIAQMDVNEAALALNGSGRMSVAGTANSVSVELAGSGHVTAQDLKTHNANVSVSGSGQVQAHADQDAELMLAGSGTAEVQGTNECQINKSGSGVAACSS
jgi:hypothetical protein